VDAAAAAVLRLWELACETELDEPVTCGAIKAFIKSAVADTRA